MVQNYSNIDLGNINNNETNNHSNYETSNLTAKKDLRSIATPSKMRKNISQYNMFRVHKADVISKKPGNNLGQFFNDYRMTKSLKKYPQLDEDWSKFCRGNQGVRSNLSCKNCNYVICMQGEQDAHAYDWLKNQYYKHVGDPSPSNKIITHDHNKSNSVIHSDLLKPRPREIKDCNGVFLKDSDWMRFNYVDTSGKVACPKCRCVVGLVKLSGLKCSCGNWNIPGFQILKKYVNLNKA